MTKEMTDKTTTAKHLLLYLLYMLDRSVCSKSDDRGKKHNLEKKSFM